MDLKVNAENILRNIERSQEINSQTMASLELLQYGFRVMQDKEPVSYRKMDHQELAKLASSYNEFIYKISRVLNGIIDACYNNDMYAGSAIRNIGDVTSDGNKLNRLFEVLKGRTIPEKADIPESVQTTNFIAEQDSLLMMVEELLSGNDDDFEKDMANYEVEASV